MLLTILALAQMPWTSHLPERGLALDLLRPKVDGGGTSLTSAAAYLSGRVPVGADFSLRLELPFTHLGVSGFSSDAFGNPYVGLESARGRITYALGFRPALAPDDEIAVQLGIYSDVTRFEAFLPHVASLSGRITYRNENSNGVTFEVGGGPSGWIPTAGGDAELVLHQHASVGYRGSKAWMGFGFGGILAVTADGDFGERSFYQLGASVGLAQGQVRPALHLILPLDDAISSDVDFVMGLGVAIAIK